MSFAFLYKQDKMSKNSIYHFLFFYIFFKTEIHKCILKEFVKRFAYLMEMV